MVSRSSQLHSLWQVRSQQLKAETVKQGCLWIPNDQSSTPESCGYVLPFVAGDDIPHIHLPGTADSLQEGYQVQQGCVISFQLPLLDL